MKTEFVWKKCTKKPLNVKFRKVNGIEIIETKEGKLIANNKTDYIIQGIEGEIYPIKKSIFAKTYLVKSFKKEKCAECDCEKAFENEGAYYNGYWFNCCNCLESYKCLKNVKLNRRWKNR